MQVVSRKEALLQGLLRYFTGKPCKRGHVSERQVSNLTCMECLRIKNSKDRAENPEKFKEIERRKYLKHSEKIKVRVSAYYYANRNFINEKVRLDRVRNPEKYKAFRESRRDSIKEYRKANAGLINSHTAKRRALSLKATPNWANLNKIREVYLECDRISKETGVAHNVHHEIPLQGKYVCGLHVEYNLSIISASENFRLSNSHESDDWN